MIGLWKAKACDARMVETPPPHNSRPYTGKEPGVKCVLVELDSNETTNLWPTRAGPDLRRPYTMGFVLNKEGAAKLSAKLKELSELMED